MAVDAGDVVSGEVVGRRRELGRLHAELAAVGTTARTVVVPGPAGVGKTRLVRAFLDGCTRTRRFLATGRSDAPPFGLVHDAFAHVAEAGSVRTPAAAVALARHLTGDGAVWWFDDLQRADPDSLRSVIALAGAQGLPALVVVTLRDEEVPASHAPLVAEVSRGGHTTHLPLGPLGLGATRDLVAAVAGRPAGAREVAVLHRRSGGHPWLLDRLVRAGAGPELGSGPLPPSVREALGVWLPPLAPAAGQVTRVVAVLGEAATFDAIRATFGQPAATVEPALADAIAARVVVESGSGFAIRTPLLREAVLAALVGPQRRRLHQRALAVVRSDATPDPRLVVEQALGADRLDLVHEHAATAVTRLLAAGDPVDAVLLADRVLGAGLDTPDLRRRATEAALAAGFGADARVHADHVAAAARAAASPADEAWAERHLAAAARTDGDARSERSHLDTATRLAASVEDPAELARCRAAAAAAAATAGRPADALRSGHAALALAEDVTAPDAVAQALLGIGIAHDRSGRSAAALQALRRARRIARDQSLPVWELAAVDEQLRVLERDAPPAEAEALIQEALDLSAGRGGAWPGRWRLALARVRLRQGDLDAAASLGEEALDTLSGHPSAEPAARATVAELRYEAGDPEAGLETLEPVVDRLDALEDPTLAAATRAGAALLAGAAGDTPEKWRHADALVDLARSAPTGAVAPARVLVDLTAVAGDAERAGHLWRRLGARGRRLGDAAWPHHVEGAMAEALGDHEGAATAYRASVDADEGRRGRICLAAAHVGLARALRRLGRLDESQQQARRAVRLLARADGWRRTEARTLSRAPARGGGGPLSPREREVAALVATGRSNPQIAAELWIAPKTASAHVSHILTKLGFSSRAEIAAWAALEGLVTVAGDGSLVPTSTAEVPAG